ncbi:MAG: acyl-CoA dehydrogenase family protein [Gemmatimonadaceae bacterium]
MPDRSFLDWPFFNDSHRELAARFASWVRSAPALDADIEPRGSEIDTRCTALAKQLGSAGWLAHAAISPYGGTLATLDVRSLCLMRETLAFQSGLADFVFALQALGAGPITLFGSDDLKRRYLPGVCSGDSLAAFALSEADAGSDVAAMQTVARLDGDSYVIDGEKTWISNAGIAAFYVVFCRFPEGGDRSYVALVVDASSSGLAVAGRAEITAPHPIGTLSFRNCRVPAASLIGAPGKGMSIALGTLDVFRSTVAAAALGFARRALDESLGYAATRRVSGGALADTQLAQAKIARMATDIDASALLVYRAAWRSDTGAARVTREAAMAKWFATEAAQRAADDAVQIFGGRGVVAGSIAERLYREVRALRIYEGTSEVQQLVIAGQTLAHFRSESTPTSPQRNAK